MNRQKTIICVNFAGHKLNHVEFFKLFTQRGERLFYFNRVSLVLRLYGKLEKRLCILDVRFKTGPAFIAFFKRF
jgi:hypothetical protein